VVSVNDLTGVVNLTSADIPTSDPKTTIQDKLDDLEENKLSVVSHDSSLNGDGSAASPLSVANQPDGSGIIIYDENLSYAVGDVVSRANALFKLAKAKLSGN
jgi:hypothetical protein